MKLWSVVVLLAVALAGCSQQDQEQMRRDADKAKSELKKDGDEAQRELKKAGHEASTEMHKAGEELKRETGRKDTNR